MHRKLEDSAKTLDARLSAQIPRLEAFLRKLSPGEEEDLLQEVLARALKYGHAFKEGGSLSGWLMKTAFRVYLDSREKQKKAPGLLGDRVWDLPAPREEIRENRETVEKLLHALDLLDRDLLLRFHCQGETIEEIAHSLKIPEGTVKARLHRARRKLAARKIEDPS